MSEDLEPPLTSFPTAGTNDEAVEHEEEEEEEIVQLYQKVEFWATIVLSLAAIATAWVGFQSSRWGGEETRHNVLALTAVVKSGQFSQLAEQRVGVHVGLVTQWADAESTGNQRLADLLFARFPEPLKSAAVAWEATQPLTNPVAPPSPFDMPQYVLPDRIAAERWSNIAITESAAAEHAGEVADQYLLYTIIFAIALFFCGISGKFHLRVPDIAVLVVGGLMLLIAVALLFKLPTI